MAVVTYSVVATLVEVSDAVCVNDVNTAPVKSCACVHVFAVSFKVVIAVFTKEVLAAFCESSKLDKDSIDRD